MEDTNKNKADYVHSVFESIARDYDRMNAVISLGMHRRWRRKTLRKMDLRPGDRAVDVCSGTCDWAIDFAQAAGDSGNVTALDFSQRMLDVGESKVEQAGVASRVRLVKGDAMQLPFADNSFDFATIGFALRNVQDIRTTLSEMKRVVKPGGKVVSLEVSKPPFPPFRMLFYFYFYRILPLLGKVMAGKGDQYEWLPRSLTHFPDSRELASIFEEVGLEAVSVHRFAGGASALHIGRKKE